MNYSWNQQYLLRDGRPWMPVMGEIHYSRVPCMFWKEHILKMKAGGIDIISCYAFWLHHEYEEDVFNFQGQRNLKEFLCLCRQANMLVFLRVGPWCHGEARNGGFPDWLLKKPFELRRSNPEYMALVKRYWEQLFRQSKDFLYPAGPVIGMQIENEYGHCGGTGGDKHMNDLKALATEIGFDLPYYTATGWGGANIGDMLPVMGGYCDAPWDRSIHQLKANNNYIFSAARNDAGIASDFEENASLTFDVHKYPFLLAELGSGLQVTHLRRPVVTGQDTGAMSLVKLGSGANLLGYYMYSGGTNPGPGLHESRASGGYCDLPELNYDFQAPIREYGQISDLHKEIKLLAMFLQSYDASFACTRPVYPKTNPKTAENRTDLRFCIRSDGDSGYIFFNNHQRLFHMQEHRHAFCVQLAGETIMFPEIHIPDGCYGFFPFNMKLGDALLKSATATPLCVLNKRTFVFYTDNAPNYNLLGQADIITLTRDEALNAYVVKDRSEHLIVCPSPVLQDGNEIFALTDGPCRYTVYPEGNHGMLYPSVQPGNARFETICMTDDTCDIRIFLDHCDDAHECFLRLDYEGDTAELYMDGRKIADSFYLGDIWEVGLKRFSYPAELTIRIHALAENEPVYLERWPDMQHGRAMRLKAISIRKEYKVAIDPSGFYQGQSDANAKGKRV